MKLRTRLPVKTPMEDEYQNMVHVVVQVYEDRDSVVLAVYEEYSEARALCAERPKERKVHVVPFFRAPLMEP